MAIEKTGAGDLINEWFLFTNEGSMNALSSIYYAYFNLLFDYGRKFTPDDFLIEDAIQNVFTNLIKFRKQLENVRSVKSYLMVSFRNELFQQIRHNRKLRMNDQAFKILFVPEYSIEEEIEQEENQSQVRKILLESLQNLTPKQQEIMFLRYDAGLSYEEISKTLNIRVESCRTAVYRAIRGIKDDFRQLGHKGLMFLYIITGKIRAYF